MAVPWWRRSLTRKPRLPRRAEGGPARRQAPKFKPRLEALEDRSLMSAGGVDVILEWNAVMIQADAVDHSGFPTVGAENGGPTRAARAFAIVSAAMFDAYNSVDTRFTPYLTLVPDAQGASVDAAVAQAAHDTLVALYPRQTRAFDALLTQTLARVPNGPAEDLGRAVGFLVAQNILDARAGDAPFLVDGQDTQILAPGFFRTFPNEPAAITPFIGNMTPFVIDDVNNFNASDRVGRTIEERAAFLRTPEYTQAYLEVQSLGGDPLAGTPTLRTPQQEIIGIFWGYDGSPGLGTPPRLYNQIARTVAIQMGNSEADNARLFGLLNLAQADVGIAGWGAKFDETIGYDFWRPIRGIRQLDPEGILLDDNNPFTVQDPNWTPLGAPRSNPFAGEVDFTPPFPAYVSGHATFGAAAFKILADFYQTDEIELTFISDEWNGTTQDVRRFVPGPVYGENLVQNNVRNIFPLSWTSFSQMAAENAASRMFLGIHWRFDATEGIRQGNAVADYVFNNALRPLEGGPTALEVPISRYDTLLDAYLRLGYVGSLTGS